jgi:hypothetical protein
MKMLFVVYGDYIDARITNAFKQAGCKSYMKFHDATGEIYPIETRLGTHNAPGRIKTLLMAVPDEEISRLLEIVRGLRAEFPTVALRAVTFSLEECVY